MSHISSLQLIQRPMLGNMLMTNIVPSLEGTQSITGVGDWEASLQCEAKWGGQIIISVFRRECQELFKDKF